MGSKLTLTYDSASAYDGTGAQLQRIFGIYAISKLFRIKYRHTGIKTLLIHALDSFQSDTELYEYLKRVNSEFALPSSNYSQNEKEVIYKINRLTISKLARFVLQSFLRNQNILLEILNPYGIVEKFPKSYFHVRKYFGSYPNRENLLGEKSIVMHIRGGSGGGVAPGESSPRVLPNSYYLGILERIIREFCHESDAIKLVILTDTPKEDIIYRPILSQLELWIKTKDPRLSEGVSTIKGESFSEFHFDILDKFTIVHGGDPIVALERMRTADFLVMSRSSFSYVGAVLNTYGTVFYPPSFWHKPIPEWERVK
ncbi:MAG: hypothetical protein D4R50_03100 [Actinomycetales bacterium]|nr:MAG: hypothetical protein D4R50_03100 [Actinomycetales bacterium]